MKSAIRQALNHCLQSLARNLPGATTARPQLHRLRGVRIYGRVWIGEDVILENTYPDAVEMHDQSGVNLRCTLIAHWRGKGRIVIEKKARVGACCVVIASPGQTLTIGEGAMVASGSVLKSSVPPYTLVGGNPAIPMARITVPPTLDVSYEAFVGGLERIDGMASESDDLGGA